MPTRVLCVAEKNSVAEGVAKVLAGGPVRGQATWCVERGDMESVLAEGSEARRTGERADESANAAAHSCPRPAY